MTLFSSSTYNTPIALKVWDGEDPDRDADMALVEKCAWEIVGERLCVIFNISDPQAMEDARLAYICELENTLRWEVQQARQDIDAVDRNCRYLDDLEYRRKLHYYRRTIAAYHQTVDLLKQGKQSYMAAMRDNVIIFEGHRCVYLCFCATLYSAFANISPLLFSVNRREFKSHYGW